jgi:hypothetical protein
LPSQIFLAAALATEEDAQNEMGNAKLVVLILTVIEPGSRDSKMVIQMTRDAELELGGLASRKNKPLRTGADKTMPINVAFNHEGTLLAVARDFNVTVYEVFLRGEATTTATQHAEPLVSLSSYASFEPITSSRHLSSSSRQSQKRFAELAHKYIDRRKQLRLLLNPSEIVRLKCAAHICNARDSPLAVCGGRGRMLIDLWCR